MSATIIDNGQPKAKTPLKKEELEQIARQLKKKLSKASITAKQSLSPTNIKTSTTIALPKSSPLKSYIMKNNSNDHSPTNNISNLSSSPINLYSPNGKSPTHIRTPAAAFLSCSPLKNVSHADTSADDMLDSPTKRRKTSPRKMVLQEITPEKVKKESTLKPSLELTSTSTKKKPESPSKDKTTTPTMAKRELSSQSSTSSSAQNALLKTPKQNSNGNGYNDAEGADLLMYLATSPSPARPYLSNTPRVMNKPLPSILQSSILQSSQPSQSQSQSQSQTSTTSASASASANASSSAGSGSAANASSSSSSSSFLAPPPPVTPKRVINSHSNITPKNRLTPFFNTLNANGLPSQGLALTPTSFNMNDYVTFFTPSPGGAFNKNLLKTPDFHNSLLKK